MDFLLEIDALNQTMVSDHVAKLLRSQGIGPERGELAMLTLLAWAAEHHYQDHTLGQAELSALAASARRHPRRIYSCLADDRMLDAETLEEASEVLVSRLSDLFDDRSLSQRVRP